MIALAAQNIKSGIIGTRIIRQSIDKNAAAEERRKPPDKIRQGSK